MTWDWNKIFKYIYTTLIAVPIIFLLVSVGSYLSMYFTFGAVPLLGVDFEYLEGPISIFPVRPGSVIINIFFIGAFIAMPLVMVANAVSAIIKRGILFHWRIAFSLFVMNALSVSLIFTDLAGWYVVYVLNNDSCVG